LYSAKNFLPVQPPAATHSQLCLGVLQLTTGRKDVKRVLCVKKHRILEKTQSGNGLRKNKQIFKKTKLWFMASVFSRFTVAAAGAFVFLFIFSYVLYFYCRVFRLSYSHWKLGSMIAWVLG